MIDRDDLPDDEVRAAEYALGLLPQAEAETAEARAASDPAFAVLVDKWRERAAALLSDLPPVAPPETLKARLDALLDAEAADKDEAGGVVLLLWRSTSFWRAAAAALALLSAFALIPVLTTEPDPQRPETIEYYAALTPTDGPQAILIRIDVSDGAVRVKAFEVDADGRETELWLIPEGEAPVSLGVFSPETDGDVPLPEDIREKVRAGAALAISLEPAGGSPTGAPTGPIIAIGGVNSLG
ncbi:MAG: anti-sigma factor [Pseudomonadota bacterium]